MSAFFFSYSFYKFLLRCAFEGVCLHITHAVANLPLRHFHSSHHFLISCIARRTLLSYLYNPPNHRSHPPRFQKANLEKQPSHLSTVLVNGLPTKVPMVQASPIKFECTHYTTLRLPGNPPMGAVDVVIGRVVGIHIDEAVLTDGKIDIKKTVPIARCGYFEYTAVREVFEMRIPGEDPDRWAGLEGSVRGNREMQRRREGVEGEKEGEKEKKG